MWSALSVQWQMGHLASGKNRIGSGEPLIKDYINAIPINITLLVVFDISIVPESICGLFIDQRFESFQ